MKIQILQIAPTKNKELLSIEKEYEKRLRLFCKLESITLPASKSDDRTRAQEEERVQFLKKIDPKAHVVALHEGGKELSSESFAEFIRQKRDFGPGYIQFLIGGSNGLHHDILYKADQMISLSKMTFTHEMVRSFLKEQIYRAYMIMAGKRYHK